MTPDVLELVALFFTVVGSVVLGYQRGWVKGYAEGVAMAVDLEGKDDAK